MGRPCSFPFGYPDCNIRDPEDKEKSIFCSSLNNTEPLILYQAPTQKDQQNGRLWCSTKTFQNFSMIPKSYARVSDDCKGEVPDETRPEHLAGPAFKDLWKTR